MKNVSPRQREILKLVTQKGKLSIEEIQQAIGISQATAYREIQELLRMGLAAKTSGGISRLENLPTQCVQCGRENNLRTTFLIERKDGEKLVACCSHCGLMALANYSDVCAAMTIDFLYGTLLNATQAWFVLKSEVSLCCRPSILSFSNSEDAKRFVKGFGGEVLDYSSAQDKIKEMMAFKTILSL